MMIKNHRIITLLLWIIVLLSAYAKNRKSDDEFEEELAAHFYDDPVIQKLNKERDEWLMTPDGDDIKRRVEDYRIDRAIELALERTRD